MAKRFTDTGKWNHWFKGLPAKMKLAWIYINDKCDHAGILEIDEVIISHEIGFRVTALEFKEAFGDRIAISGSTLLITSFMDFQYGLLKKNAVALSAQKLRSEFDNQISTMVTLQEGCGNPEARAKEKDIDKRISNKKSDKEKDGAESAYAAYPRKEGKKRGLEICKRDVKSPEDLMALMKAIEKYKAHIAKNHVNAKFIKQFSTFMGSWRDWLDDDAGKVEKPKFDYMSAFSQEEIEMYKKQGKM
jgi:hypothetical protein